ncbi:hypothetical protein R3X43_28795, partial [Salmonella enterica subsp. enterica serovar Typhimurium]|nr:hypothetical protein [Salmonella enterica subsp. enterica serovar Typhimurium]
SWRDKQTGEMREQTEWHRVVLFRQARRKWLVNIRKLARQTDGGDAGADGMAPRGAVSASSPEVAGEY